MNPMKFYLLSFALLGSAVLHSECAASEERVFDPAREEVLSQLAKFAGEYLGRDESQKLLHPIWTRHEYQRGGELVRRDLADYRSPGRGHAGKSSNNWVTTSIHTYYSDFALMRLDDRENARVRYLALLALNGTWFCVAEVESSGAAGVRPDAITSDSSAPEVMSVIEAYYRSVEFGDGAPLEQVFHDQWQMKNPDDGDLVSEDKRTFIQRITDRPIPGYFDDRQVTGLEIIYDSIAIVRVDKPLTRSTTVFSLVKTSEGWQMLDKLWANPE